MGSKVKKAICPQCRGKVWVGIHTQNRDVECSMCKGRGYVYPDFVCICGRAAMVMIGDTLVCGRQKCADKYLAIAKMNERQLDRLTFDRLPNDGESEEEMYLRLFGGITGLT